MWVSGFYVGWMANTYPPSRIDFSSLSHVMVFSVLPRTDGTLDTTMFMGSTTGPAMAKDVAARAHAAGKKAILVIGGGGYVSGFRGATASSTIDTFVANIVNVVSSWGFDGVDLDWEPIISTDHAPLQSLVGKLRAARPSMLITVDVGWRNANLAMTTAEKAFYSQLAGSVDQMNMMTYGMADAWSGWASWHSSALTGHGSNHPSSVAASADQYLGAGVPAAKLGLGIGFYGSCWNAPVTAPLQAPNGSKVVSSDNTMSIANILRTFYSADAYRYDTTAQAPYLTFSSGVGPSACTFISYENEQSIAAKADYARTRGLGGAIIWQINEGYDANATDPNRMLHAVGNAFLDTTPRAATTTALVVSPTSSVTGQAVTLTATVASAAGTPAGNVTFLDGSTALGTAVLVNGVATLTTSSLAVGTRVLGASYGGDTTYATSTAPTRTVTVAKASTSARLVSSANPVLWRKSVTFTATVAAVAPGGGTPTGTVRFLDGTTQIGSASLSNGRATLTTSKLARGTHRITAVYGGSAGYLTVTSPVLSQVVN